MELTNAQKIANLKRVVHANTDISRKAFDPTLKRDIVNCYGYAIGSDLPYEKFYSIGNISGLRSIGTSLKSVAQAEKLLFLDMEELGLGIEKYKDDEIGDDQYLIKLILKIYANGLIHDFHFLRSEDGREWTEKWKGQHPRKLDSYSTQYDHFPYQVVGVYKVTR